MPEFEWKYADWTVCSVTCGGGYQESYAKCMEKEAGLVEDTHCAHAPKPKPVKRTCNVHQCPARWWTGPWQHCSATCGDQGRRKRTVLCVRSLGPDEQLALTDDRCAAVTKPHDLEPCPVTPLCPEDPNWITSEWSDCSESCGGGLQVRKVTCSGGRERCALSEQPASVRPCNKNPCPAEEEPSAPQPYDDTEDEERPQEVVEDSKSDLMVYPLGQMTEIQAPGTDPLNGAPRGLGGAKSSEGGREEARRQRVTLEDARYAWRASKWSKAAHLVMSDLHTSYSRLNFTFLPFSDSFGLLGNAKRLDGDWVPDAAGSMGTPSPGRWPDRPVYLLKTNAKPPCDEWLKLTTWGRREYTVVAAALPIHRAEELRQLSAATQNAGKRFASPSNRVSLGEILRSTTIARHRLVNRELTDVTGVGLMVRRLGDDVRLFPSEVMASSPFRLRDMRFPVLLSLHVRALLYLRLAQQTPTDRRIRQTWMACRRGTCTKGCGGGERSRHVKCIDKVTQQEQPAETCFKHTRHLKPSERARCNPESCLDWEVDEWSKCSARCGNGTRERLVSCPAPHKCDASIRPPSLMACHRGPCERWVAGAWSDCQGCGQNGTQRRGKRLQRVVSLMSAVNHIRLSHVDSPT
ncbi:A disintegrin and metalloproteinase with thrombospondin motifs 7-like [Tropilaelaps mercedesae]|uniref:A disintegrin and metalloproteinase with thrombospondin motifs 7-like n=1 Tax=Tropilaelaps mercedesae TaxID=418985 RepID=A0A1V9X794_9ACAR|nr:A disintegrin and metalloproteinase with thrombospondin motifs 7-like [Tropilaelaps mercedesae]